MVTLKFSRYTEIVLVLVSGKLVLYRMLPNSSITFDGSEVKRIFFPPVEDYD